LNAKHAKHAENLLAGFFFAVFAGFAFQPFGRVTSLSRAKTVVVV